MAGLRQVPYVLPCVYDTDISIGISYSPVETTYHLNGIFSLLYSITTHISEEAQREMEPSNSSRPEPVSRVRVQDPDPNSTHCHAREGCCQGKCPIFGVSAMDFDRKTSIF